MGAHEGQRLTRMPQLSQRPVDGYHPAEPARGRCPSAIALHRREDLYRLSQGHCASSAGHAERARVAVAVEAADRKRCLLMAQNGLRGMSAQWSLLGAKRTWP